MSIYKRFLDWLSNNETDNNYLFDNLPKVVARTPMPNVETCKDSNAELLVKSVICEPILSFVECVRNNPKRFLTKSIDEEFFSIYDKVAFEITDKVTGEYFALKMCRYTMPRMPFMDISENIKAFTPDELEYACNEIEKIYLKRISRLRKLRSIRARRRLTKVYCK